MSERLPQLIIMISRAFLILVGTILTALQLDHEMAQASFAAMGKTIETVPEGGIKLTTSHVGVIIVAIGAALEIVGYAATFPWKKS